MIKEVRIEKMTDLAPLFNDQAYQPDLKRNRSSFVYRGLSDVNYKMETTLFRNSKDFGSKLEPSILSSFTKYAVSDDPSIADSLWKQMFAGQHHGLPTRLLDWTHSPVIALHFAAAGTHMDKIDQTDCAVWKIDIPEVHALLPQKYQDALVHHATTKVFSLSNLEEICPTPQQYDEDMKDKSMVIVEPPSSEQRIINQYSFFSIIPKDMGSIEDWLDKNTNNTVKYVISKDLRWNICDMLDSMNISERIMYPGLDGLCKWIARHYYVR